METAANEAERNERLSAVWEDSCLPIVEAGQPNWSMQISSWKTVAYAGFRAFA